MLGLNCICDSTDALVYYKTNSHFFWVTRLAILQGLLLQPSFLALFFKKKCMCVCLHTQKYVYWYLCTFYPRMDMCRHIHLNMYTYMCTCVCLCIHICTYIHIYMYIYIHICIHAYIYLCIFTCIYLYTVHTYCMHSQWQLQINTYHFKTSNLYNTYMMNHVLSSSSFEPRRGMVT